MRDRGAGDEIGPQHGHDAMGVEPFHPHARRLAQHGQQVGDGDLHPVHLAIGERAGGGGGVRDDAPFHPIELRMVAAPAILDLLRARQIAIVFRRHGFIRGDIRVEREQILRVTDAAQREATGRDEITLPGHIEAATEIRRH